MRRVMIAGLLLAGLAGCFPLELDVNDKGELLIARQEGFFVFDPAAKTVRPILGPGIDSAVFARFSPDGKHILAVFEEFADMNHRFELVSLADSSRKVFYKGAKGLNARFSPGGETLAIVRHAQKPAKTTIDGKEVDTSRDVPELVLIEVASGKVRTFTDVNVDRFVRWFADGKRLLALTIDSRSDGNEAPGQRLRRGHLCTIDAATGKATRIASVAASDGAFLDLSPDNRTALIVADGVGPAGKPATPKMENYKDPLVWQVDLAGDSAGASREFGHRAVVALYSPDGKHVLLSGRQEQSSFNRLYVTRPDGSDEKTVVKDCATNTATVAGESPTIPGWRDNASIHYFTNRSTYDSTRYSPWLKLARLDGTSTVLQPDLDVGALEAETKIINPKKAPSGNAVITIPFP